MRQDNLLREAQKVRAIIQQREISVYDSPTNAESDDFFTVVQLEALLKKQLIGRTDLAGLAVRTRSRIAKTLVCEALGYQAPRSFKRVSPRLSHPLIDVYAQQSTNLQIWNEEIDTARRYVILILDDKSITNVRVITGADLAHYDCTGTLTSKYQASRRSENYDSLLVSTSDTAYFTETLKPSDEAILGLPTNQPEVGKVLTIEEVYRRVLPIVGRDFEDPGVVQERNRGAVIHQEVCKQLGMVGFADNGQFPDILSQLVEVKLQLARTVDLGLELPNSNTPLASANGMFSGRDVRYVIFYADRRNSSFTITHVVVVTGADFFQEYRQFGGLTTNKKLQLRLPTSWFSG